MQRGFVTGVTGGYADFVMSPGRLAKSLGRLFVAS
jgi:hypothetical protein